MQARTFHYHTEKALHETLPGKRRSVCVCGGGAFIIFLSHYCQNMLYFTFCSREKFTFSDTAVAFIVSPSHLNVEHLGGSRMFTDPSVRPG